MDWVQFATIVITFVGLFIWNRTESRADARHMDAKLESNRNLSIQIHKENKEIIDSTKALIEANQKETRSIIDAIREDIRDFHGRMCSIEERHKVK